jgi:uncharacterized protein (DUF362 family)
MEVLVRKYREDTIPAILKELGLERVIHPDDRVLLKPNFCCYLKEGVTTNLEMA